MQMGRRADQYRPHLSEGTFSKSRLLANLDVGKKRFSLTGRDSRLFRPPATRTACLEMPPFFSALPFRFGLDFYLALSIIDPMTSLQKVARLLGRRGGKARARSLSAKERKKIASQGGRSRALSHHALRRIEDNSRYLDAI